MTIPAHPLMPEATAVWLIQNTSLTFDQIAKFCCMHILEIQNIASKDNPPIPLNPIENGQLTLKEIERCSKDPLATLQLAPPSDRAFEHIRKKTHYTPRINRSARPDAIAWLLKHYPHLSDAQICRLIHTTRATILAVRARTHKNAHNIKPHDPVLMNLCTQKQLNDLLLKSQSHASELTSQDALHMLDDRHENTSHS